MLQNIDQEKEKWFKNLVMDVFIALEEKAYSYNAATEHSIVKFEEIEEYVYLSTNVAGAIMAQAIKQYYINIKGSPKYKIYEEVLNDFEENVKYHLQKLEE